MDKKSGMDVGREKEREGEARGEGKRKEQKEKNKKGGQRKVGWETEVQEKGGGDKGTKEMINDALKT